MFCASQYQCKWSVWEWAGKSERQMSSSILIDCRSAIPKSPYDKWFIRWRARSLPAYGCSLIFRSNDNESIIMSVCVCQCVYSTGSNIKPLGLPSSKERKKNKRRLPYTGIFLHIILMIYEKGFFAEPVPSFGHIWLHLSLLQNHVSDKCDRWLNNSIPIVRKFRVEHTGIRWVRLRERQRVERGQEPAHTHTHKVKSP